MKKLNLEAEDTGISSDSEVHHQQGKENTTMEVDNEKDHKKMKKKKKNVRKMSYHGKQFSA